jgi:hypothetical protein
MADHEDVVREHLKRHSKANIDEYIRITTFADPALHDGVWEPQYRDILYYGRSSRI